MTASTLELRSGEVAEHPTGRAKRLHLGKDRIHPLVMFEDRESVERDLAFEPDADSRERARGLSKETIVEAPTLTEPPSVRVKSEGRYQQQLQRLEGDRCRPGLRLSDSTKPGDKVVGPPATMKRELGVVDARIGDHDPVRHQLAACGVDGDLAADSRISSNHARGDLMGQTHHPFVDRLLRDLSSFSLKRLAGRTKATPQDSLGGLQSTALGG